MAVHGRGIVGSILRTTRHHRQPFRKCLRCFPTTSFSRRTYVNVSTAAIGHVLPPQTGSTSSRDRTWASRRDMSMGRGRSPPRERKHADIVSCTLTLPKTTSIVADHECNYAVKVLIDVLYLPLGEPLHCELVIHGQRAVYLLRPYRDEGHVHPVNGLCLVEKLRNDLSTIFANAKTAINHRSVDGAQCISSCDCMTSILALMTCAEPSLLFFGSYSGKPNLNASLPQEIVVWVRGVRPGCGSCHRMCASVPPFHFVYIRTAPKTARPYSRSHSRSSE